MTETRPLINIAKKWFESQGWKPFPFQLAAWRGFCLIVRKDKSLLQYDAALIAGIAYIFAFAILKLPESYYLLPAYVCWIVAMGGYVGRLYDSFRAATKAEIGRDSPVVHSTRYVATKAHLPIVTAMGALLLLTSWQLPTAINQIGESIEKRFDTKVLTGVFSDLDDNGFDLYVFFPNEKSGRAEMLQSWRQTVVNAFASNARGVQSAAATRAAGPFQRLGPDDFPRLSSKCVLIRDPNFSANVLSQANSKDETFNLVRNVPSIMGAQLYSREIWMKQINQIVHRHQQRIPYDAAESGNRRLG